MVTARNWDMGESGWPLRKTVPKSSVLRVRIALDSGVGVKMDLKKYVDEDGVCLAERALVVDQIATASGSVDDRSPVY